MTRGQDNEAQNCKRFGLFHFLLWYNMDIRGDDVIKNQHQADLEKRASDKKLNLAINLCAELMNWSIPIIRFFKWLGSFALHLAH